MGLVDNDDQQLATPDAGAVSVVSSNVSSQPHDPYFALRFSNFRFLLISSFLSSIGEKMLEVALGWDLYERTHSALALGGVGLVLIIPVIIFVLPAGHIADRFDRKRIILIAQSVMVLASLGLTAFSITRSSIGFIYACLLVIGSATAFGNPASSAFMAQTIPEEAFENAATWSSSSWQLAAVIGPGLGGVLIALLNSTTVVYILNVVTALAFIYFIALIHVQKQPPQPVEAEQESMWKTIYEGLVFFRRTPILLAAITLDLFAVLLGGATTLLPIFSSDILHMGAAGLGWLRTAPSVGAICMTFILAHRPPMQKAGRTLLVTVIGFGLATIVFGLSRNFWLSLVMLFLLGGFDNVSVIIRSSLMMTRIPDAMRGRASAVNALFVGASNELGGFESGLTAQFFGSVASVVAGGVGTILVVLCVACIWPEMRTLGTLREPES